MNTFHSAGVENGSTNSKIDASITAQNDGCSAVPSRPLQIQVAPASESILPKAAIKPLVRNSNGGLTQLPGAVDPASGMDFKDWDPTCLCGKRWNDHSPLAQKNYIQSDKTWKPDLHTMPIPTDTFGEVEFVGFGQKISKVPR